MNNKRVFIGSLATVFAAGTIGVSVTNAHFSGNNTRRDTDHSSVEQKKLSIFHDVVQNGLTENEFLTNEEIAAITYAYQLRSEGKYDEAREELENAGIENEVQSDYVHVQKASVRDAIESADWSEYQESVEGTAVAKNIDTEEKFMMLVEAYQLRKEGRSAEAQEIMQDLGLAYDDK